VEMLFNSTLVKIGSRPKQQNSRIKAEDRQRESHTKNILQVWENIKMIRAYKIVKIGVVTQTQ